MATAIAQRWRGADGAAGAKVKYEWGGTSELCEHLGEKEV